MSMLFKLNQTPNLEIKLKEYMQKTIPFKREKSRVLSDSEVVTIREAYDREGYTMRELAEINGVTETLIAKIIHGELYTDVGGPINKINTRRNRKGKATKKGKKHATPDIIDAIIRDSEVGNMTQKEIAVKYGVSRPSVSHYVTGRRGVKSRELVEEVVELAASNQLTLDDISEFLNSFDNVIRIKVEIEGGYTIEKNREERQGAEDVPKV